MDNITRLAELQRRSANGAANDENQVPWPEVDLDIASDDQKPPPAFDTTVFSPRLLDWVKGTAEDCSAPIDYVAAALIGAASALLGNVRRVSPWPGWVEHPFLWIALVGPPSSGKTPALLPFKAAIGAYERGLRPTYEETLRQWEAQREEAAERAEAWKKSIKKAVETKAAAPDKPKNADPPPKPMPPRALIVDATTQEAARLLSDNPQGLLLIRSELAGWLGQMDRYGGNGADRAFYLESYDGGHHVVDRVKHSGDPIVVDYCSLAIIAGLQPDKLRTVFSGPDDGLAERFLYFWPQSVAPRRPEHNRAESRAAALRRLFTRLRSLDWGRGANGERIPVVVKLAPEAAMILDEVRMEIHRAEQDESGLMACWRGKNSGRLLRAALTLEFLEWAMGDDPVAPETVSLLSMRRAGDFLEYCTAMMKRALGELALPLEDRYAAHIARMIREEKPDTVNERTLYQRAKFAKLRDRSLRDKTLAVLCEGSWLRLKPSRGRAARRRDWQVNPQLRVEP